MPKKPSGPFPISEIVRRVASTDPTTKTWTCPHCGEIPARALRQAPGYYIRQSCACEEREQERQAQERLQAGQTARNQAPTYAWIGQDWADLTLREKTFAAFERARQPEAFEATRAFAAQPHGTLVLFGGYGVGKTHLLAAIANEFCRTGKSCLYVSAVALFEVLQERIQQNRKYHDLLKRAIHAPLLLIDDLDKPKPSEFREAIYYLLIDKRTLAGRPLAISSNVAPPEWDRWIGKAARSRLLMELCPIEMRGPDYRLLKRPKAEVEKGATTETQAEAKINRSEVI